MEKPILYKKIPAQSVVNRPTESLTDVELTSVTTTISKFIEFFKAKHL